MYWWEKNGVHKKMGTEPKVKISNNSVKCRHNKIGRKCVFFIQKDLKLKSVLKYSVHSCKENRFYV